MGRMFDLWVIVYIWAVFSITEVARVLGVLFSTIKVMYHFCPKMGWATTWAIFLQTHLVTLVATAVDVAKPFQIKNTLTDSFLHMHTW